MSARQALADAANTVAGVNVSPVYKQPTKPGEGRVWLANSLPDSSGFGFLNTWEVLIRLPDSVPVAEAWIDANLPALIEALGDVFNHINRAGPTDIPDPSGKPVLGLLIEGNCAA